MDFIRASEIRMLLGRKCFSRKEFISGVPQDSVLAAILYLVNVNDIHENAGTLSCINMNAADVQIPSVVQNESSCDELEQG